MKLDKDLAWPLIAYVDKGRMMTLEEIATLVDLVRADPEGIKAERDRHKDNAERLEKLNYKLCDQLEAADRVLIKIIGHTGLPPYPSRDLLLGLIDSIKHIATAAIRGEEAQG